MRIELDPTAETPLYQQLHDRVIDAVARGELRAGDALVSVRQLAVRFGINAATVVKAYDALRHEGIVRTSRRSGSVIARDPESGPPDERFLADWSARLSALVAEGIAHGVSASELEARAGAFATAFAAAREGQAREGQAREGQAREAGQEHAREQSPTRETKGTTP